MELPPSTDEILEIAATILQPGDPVPGRCAVVAERDVVYGMFRMLESLTDRPDAPPVRVFRNEPDALDWLGVRCEEGGGSGLLH